MRGQQAGPTTSDHWHAAIGFDICGTFVAHLEDAHGGAVGIHTHGDGLIHIHPTSQGTGRRATLGRWLEEVGAEVTGSKIDLPDGPTERNGMDCDGQRAVVRVVTWPSPESDGNGDTVTGDPSDILLQNQMVITVAFLPPDAAGPQASVDGDAEHARLRWQPRRLERSRGCRRKNCVSVQDPLPDGAPARSGKGRATFDRARH